MSRKRIRKPIARGAQVRERLRRVQVAASARGWPIRLRLQVQVYSPEEPGGPRNVAWAGQSITVDVAHLKAAERLLARVREEIAGMAGEAERECEGVVEGVAEVMAKINVAPAPITP